jgi:hypothetical protein
MHSQSKIKNKSAIVPDRRSTNWTQILMLLIVIVVLLVLGIPSLMYVIFGGEETKTLLTIVFKWGRDGLALIGLGLMIQKVFKFFEGKI